MTSDVINDVVLAVIDLMNGTAPFATVTRGALPTGPGLTCEVGPSTPDMVFLDKNASIPLDITLNGKHADLEVVTKAMNTIHSALTRAKTYPSGEGWEIYDITNATLPQKIGREDNEGWIVASSLTVKFYWFGD